MQSGEELIRALQHMYLKFKLVVISIMHALAKLKHAFDLWNSNIFLIISNEKDFCSAQELLNGTFHEIKEKIRIIPAEDFRELHERKLSWIELEQKVGIL